MTSQYSNSELVEQSTLKMILFSTGYFLNGFLLIAFNNYVWTFYEAELGIINFISLWPIYMALANTIYTIWSMISNPLLRAASIMEELNGALGKRAKVKGPFNSRNFLAIFRS